MCIFEKPDSEAKSFRKAALHRELLQKRAAGLHLLVSTLDTLVIMYCTKIVHID